MTPGATLFQLNVDAGQLFDGSNRGVAVLAATNAKALDNSAGIVLNAGSVELARHPSLDGLQVFTMSANINPQTLAGSRRNIVEGQTPGIAFFIEPAGKLIGSVNTARGWQSVDSGNTVLKQGTQASVQFSRDSTGLTTLQINGAVVGSKTIAGPITNAGAAGFKIGSAPDGRTYPFLGIISTLQIVHDVVTPQVLSERQATIQKVLTAATSKITSKAISVILDPDPAAARLQQLRLILNAAGVTRLSDLSTLKLTAPTRMTPNKILVAPRPSNKIAWGQIAAEISTGNAATVRTRLAQYLTNRNSIQAVKALSAASSLPTVSVSPITGGVRTSLSAAAAATATAGAAVRTPLIANLTDLRQRIQPTQIQEVLHIDGEKIKISDIAVLDKFTSKKPTDWPVTANPGFNFITPVTIPIDSAVIIAQTLDLTSTTLQVDRAVSTLYIIAEEVICGPGASITWTQTPSTTPPRLDNPELNGRNWNGVQTQANSRQGLRGGDGLGGESGIPGTRGVSAPAIEMWVKTLTAIPNINLNGQNGAVGGRGQKGGSGGHGGDGALGHRWWLFGWHCDTQGGDGGDGGNGGTGGAGGPGGTGGNGGSITVGTLKGTLAFTVTNKSFLLKNQGAQPGQGGPGGAGGLGGGGGRSGNGETCHDARDGHAGAQAQPGSQGARGALAGVDAPVSLFEFTQEDWDELLTRPWISKAVPTDISPGQTLTIFGTAFTAADHIVLDGALFTPTVNADQSISMAIPLDITGGSKSLSVRRTDGTESNRLTISIKPQLDAIHDALAPASTINLAGHAFLSGASVLINGAATPAQFHSKTSLSFQMPGTGGSGSTGGSVSVQVRNPDGWTSNSQTASRPRILEIPFVWGTNNLQFKNPTSGVPDWGTYQDTFGSAEVWHELLDPIFGHPVLTAAFYFFYQKFLKGKGDGGLCTGFCTSVASKVADDLWTGRTDTHNLTLNDSLHKWLTGVHGKLLSRQSLIHFHDQGRHGIGRVETSIREIEATFLRGCDRNSAPLLFFIPSGEVWDSGYFDRLGSSHCVMPYRFVYPDGHPGPRLSDDGTTTVSSLDGVKVFVWDTNNPESQNCRAELSLQGGILHFQYFPDGPVEFTSEQGITFGEWNNGSYLLGDHDLPFSGPLGLTTFIIDFLASPADLQVVDDSGNRTGTFGTQIRSEIPGSHPCYLAPNMFMLPAETALSRTIIGNGAGTYAYHSIMPNHGSLLLENVPTAPGQSDDVAISSDGTQLRFSTISNKTFDLTVARLIDGQARAISIKGVGASLGADIDLTVSPDLSVVRVGNQSAARTVQVSAFAFDKTTNTPLNKILGATSLPTQHDLVVTVPDWNTLNLSAQALSFN